MSGRWPLRFVFLLSLIPSGASGENSESAPNPPYGLESRPPWTTSRVVGTPEPPPPYRMVRAYPGMKVQNPIFVAQEPGTDRLLVAEEPGKIWAFPVGAETVEWRMPFHESPRKIYAFSFHPNYEENGEIFIFSTNGPAGHGAGKSRVTRLRTTLTAPRRVRPDSEELILEWKAGGHNGGEAIIGPDGYLYAALGDSTSDSDGDVTGQDITNLFATVVRLDVENPDPGRAYSIPPDNPFVDVPGARGEIWAFGFRNPFRISFDSKGRLWCGDVGQDLWEMIRVVTRGGNYGWSVQEGSHPFYPNRKRGPGPILPPVVEHHHTESRSITGGYEYHGDKFPELRGMYLYGDYQFGTIWGVRYDGERVTSHEVIAETPVRISSFGLTRDGDFLALDYDTGMIHRLERQDKVDDESKFPRKLSESGIFTAVERHELAPGVLRFSVNAPGWFDGAVVDRFVAMPGSAQIGFQETSGGDTLWGLADGSVVGQTLSLEAPSGPRRVETRILVGRDRQWLAYTYLWNDAQNDAELVDAPGADITVEVADTANPGGTREQMWRVPSRNECMACHSRVAGYLLGFQTKQMNGDHHYGPVVDNQLRAFEHAGIFNGKLPKRPKDLGSLANPRDESVELETRVRSYLDVNCAVCHANAGGGNAKIHVGVGTGLKDTKLIDEPPVHNTFGLADARIIAPGDPYASVLYYRIATSGHGRMPRADSVVPDDRALEMVHAWIRQLGTDAETGKTNDPLRPEEAAALAALRAPDADARTTAQQALLASSRGALILSRFVTNECTDSALRDTIVRAALESANQNVRGLFERFVPPRQRTSRLGVDIDAVALLSVTGDAERGRESLLAGVGSKCKTCHTIQGQGKNAGPDLSQIGKKYSRADLLDSILNPSKKVEPQYAMYLAVTKTGNTVTGIVQEKTEGHVVLVDASGQRHRLASDEILQMAPQSQSLMPDQLWRDWTAQQAADVLEYLTTLK